MKKAKKMLAIILVLVMAASIFTGCSKKAKEETKTEDSASKDGKTKIKFWCHSNEPWVKAYKNMIDKFEEKYPEYEVELTDYPYDVYNEKIQTALTADSDTVDVIAVWGGRAPEFIETDALAQVPEELEKDLRADYLEPALGIYEKEGNLYGVAMEFNLEYGGMIANKKLFDQAGLSYPTTWEELRTTSKAVAKSNGDLLEMRGFEMIDEDALICNYLAMILQQGGQYIQDDNSVNFATPEGIKAMEEIISMVKDKEMDLESLTKAEYTYNDVYQDKGFMSSVGSWGIGEGTDTYGLTYGQDFEYVQVPQYGDTMAFAAETGWGLVVPENSKKQDAAWKFIQFFTEPENLVQHNIACNQLPPRKSLLDNEEYKAAMPQISFLLDILPNGQWMGAYNTSAMREILNEKFIELCQTDNPDVEGALKEISKQITEECQISYSTK